MHCSSHDSSHLNCSLLWQELTSANTALLCFLMKNIAVMTTFLGEHNYVHCSNGLRCKQEVT